MRRIRCYAIGSTGDQSKLLYETASIEALLRNVTTMYWEMHNTMDNPQGINMFVTKGCKEIPVCYFAVTRKGKLYAYIGQGIYQYRASGRKMLAKYIRGAILRWNQQQRTK